MVETETFIVSGDCFDLGLRAGAILFRDVRISDSGPELRSEIDSEMERIRSELAGPAEVRSTPHVARLHEIFKRIGVKPRKNAPSVEGLLEYALKRGALPVVNNLVDTYNLVSVRTGCSLGAHDLDRITTPVELRFLRGDETFTPLGSDQAREVRGGEFGYVDAANRVICRLDVLQADFSKVSADTKRALLIVEGTTAHDEGELRRVFADTAALVKRHCGGEAEIVAFP